MSDETFPDVRWRLTKVAAYQEQSITFAHVRQRCLAAPPSGVVIELAGPIRTRG